MVALVWLDPGDPFPPTSEVLDDPEGLLAAGADLPPTTLTNAYSRGIFPWFSDGDPILWWSPTPRMVLNPAHFHASRSLLKFLRRTDYHFAIDQHFADVIRHCAAAPREGQPGTWITEEMQQAYIHLHNAGIAHSVEVYQDGQLVGGLYGVCIGEMFFGESMFSLKDNASKCALFLLCALRNELGISLIDCQMQTPHLVTLGAQPLSRDQFESALAERVNEANKAEWRATASDLASWRRRYRLEV